MEKPTDKALAFTNWLSELVSREQTGDLATLRRGLMLDEDCLYKLFSHIPPGFLAGLRPWDEKVYLMIASLFAYHPIDYTPEELANRRFNLGDSLRRLAIIRNSSAAADQSPTDELPATIKRRFEIVISCARSDLLGHLRQLTRLLKNEGVPVDWAMLLCDLQAWELRGNYVQWKWSRSFYVGNKGIEGEKNNVS